MSRIGSFFRSNNSTIAFGIIFVAFALILYLQSLATARLQEQLRLQQQITSQIRGVTNQINDSSKRRTIQIDALNRHIDCIALFFAQPDRTNKSIKDVETCQLQNTSTGALSSPQPVGNLQGGTSPQPSPRSSSEAPAVPPSAPPKPNPVQSTVSPLDNLLNGVLRVQ